MLISIVVPVYNVEKYINACIDSILSQSFKDYEIILVDDGSTDKSGKICDSYQNNNKNIRVIHQVNGGLSDARNTGIKEASGEYLLFIDSDDYIAEEALKNIVLCLKRQNRQIDLMFLEAIKIYPDNTSERMGDGYQEKYINGQSKALCMQHLSELPKFPAAAWTKLVRRDFIKKNKLFFTKGLLSEDVDWTIGVLKYAEHFAYCSTIYYYYRQNRSGSITKTAGIKSVDSLLWTINKWASKDLARPYQKEINSFLAYEYIMALMVYTNLEQEDRMKVIEKMNNIKWVLIYANTYKTKFFKVLCMLFGVHYGALIGRKIDQVRRIALSLRRRVKS